MRMINNRGSQCLALLITVAPSLGWSPCGRVFAGDHLDVDVLGNGGEGDLKSTDGRGGRAPSLHISQPGALLIWLARSKPDNHGGPEEVLVWGGALSPDQRGSRAGHNCPVVSNRLHPV